MPLAAFAGLEADGGTTFGAPTLITSPLLYQPSGIRNQGGKPAVAADRTTGNLYLVYQSLSNGSPKIFFTNDSSEYWGRAASLIHITADGAKALAPGR